MKRYPGLTPFSPEDQDVFFGRDDDVQYLSELIFVERKVLLYSKSGYGKTSLLHAGIVPELSKNKNFEFILIRFYSFTEASLKPDQTFLQAIGQHQDLQIDESVTLIDHYAKEHSNNYWAIFKKNQLLGNHNKTYILIFDQFEELFSYPDDQINAFKQLFSEIILTNNFPDFFDDFEDQVFANKASISSDKLDLLYEDINIKAVFVMRADRLSQLNILADKIADIQKVFYELKALDTTQAKQAIIMPAQRSGDFDSPTFNYEEAAIKKIINALTAGGKQKIETTQLQIVCQRLEDDIIENKITENKITEKDIPSFKDMFLEFYEQATNKGSSEDGAKIRKFIEDNLIIENRRVSLDELICQKYISKKTLRTLVDSRLLRAERNSTEGFSYELSHDTLVPPILEQAQQRRNKEEKAQLHAKQLRQIRIIVIAVLVAILSIGVAIYTYFLRGQAEKQANIAKEQTAIASETLQKLKDEQRKQDSLTFHFHLREGINQKARSNYRGALQSLQSALQYDSTPKVLQLMEECRLQMAKEEQFQKLLSEGQNFEIKGDRFYAQARRKYQQARRLNYNNQLVDNNLLLLEKLIEAFVIVAKDSADFLLKANDNENAKNLWILPALELKPNDKKLKDLLKQANQ